MGIATILISAADPNTAISAEWIRTGSQVQPLAPPTPIAAQDTSSPRMAERHFLQSFCSERTFFNAPT